MRRERAGGRKEEQPGHREREKESDQDASDEDTVEGGRENTRDEKHGQRFALGTRYIDRPYAMLAQWRGVLGR